jgi:hypothetical protein
MTQPDNLGSLASLSGMWIDRIAERRPMTTVMLDMDSCVSPTFGDQENTAYNGHFGCTSYHPLFVFNQFGDLERFALRSGNVHSADGWHDVLEPVIARYRNRKMRRFFRADAAFAMPEVYEFLEAAGYKYTIRLPANQVLQGRIAIRYKGKDLAYRTFDKIRKVNQAAVVENKRLGSLLQLIKTHQERQPLEQRSRKAPKRRDQTGHMFSVG